MCVRVKLEINGEIKIMALDEYKDNKHYCFTAWLPILHNYLFNRSVIYTVIYIDFHAVILKENKIYILFSFSYSSYKKDFGR